MKGSATTGTRRESAVFTLRVDREKLAEYQKVAEAEHRTISQKLRAHIDQTLAEREAA